MGNKDIFVFKSIYNISPEPIKDMFNMKNLLFPCYSSNHIWIPWNPLGLKQNGRCFAHDTFKWIFLNENVTISIKVLLKFVAKGSINNIPALVQIIAWRRSGDKPLSEPMMVSLLTHICVTRPQWVNVTNRIHGPVSRIWLVIIFFRLLHINYDFYELSESLFFFIFTLMIFWM